MATRSYVPRADNEGGIGKESKHWKDGYINNMHVHNLSTPQGNIDDRIYGLNAKVETIEFGLNAKVETIESGLNAKVETIESGLNAKADKLENGHAIVRSVNNQYADDSGNVNVNVNGFSIGDIKWSSIDMTQAGFLVANGASVRRDTYPDLCSYYEIMGFPFGIVDDEHFNLPNLIGRFPEGAESVGGYKEAGLPNIEGQHGQVCGSKTATPTNTGCFSYARRVPPIMFGDFAAIGDDRYEDIITFNASKSNLVYGNSNTVQPKSTLLIPYVKAFKGASASSTDIEISKVANDLADKANRSLTNIASNVDFVVESYNDEEGNWYRKYRSGWLVQGGKIESWRTDTERTVSFLKPMANIYNLSAIQDVSGLNSSYTNAVIEVKNISSTSAIFVLDAVAGSATINVAYWSVSGMGAE